MVDVRDVLRKHSARIEGQIKTSDIKNVNYSREYIKFKQEMAPDLTRFEKWCRSLGSVIKLKVAEKDEVKNSSKSHILRLNHGRL